MGRILSEQTIQALQTGEIWMVFGILITILYVLIVGAHSAYRYRTGKVLCPMELSYRRVIHNISVGHTETSYISHKKVFDDIEAHLESRRRNLFDKSINNDLEAISNEIKAIEKTDLSQ